MSYMILNPESDNGHFVGKNEHCAQFVKKRGGMPDAPEWKEGTKVKGDSTLRRGTVIATFVNGQYPDNGSGQHAAVYESQDNKGIWVWDQWIGQPVHKRYIPFRGSDYTGKLSNNADAFSVVE